MYSITFKAILTFHFKTLKALLTCLLYMQVFKVIKLLLGKLEKASEDPESALNQAGEHEFFF